MHTAYNHAVPPVRIVAALMLCALPLTAQQPAAAGPWQQAAANDMTQVERKFVGLAEAMPESTYSWRPSEGVRSVGEVFTHVAFANYLFGQIIGTPIPADVNAKYPNPDAFTAVTNKAEIVSMLRASFAHARSVVSSVPTDKFATQVKMFGQDTPMPDAFLLYMTHNHEHLGQSIAYARSNKVVPPWSAGN